MSLTVHIPHTSRQGGNERYEHAAAVANNRTKSGSQRLPVPRFCMVQKLFAYAPALIPESNVRYIGRENNGVSTGPSADPRHPLSRIYIALPTRLQYRA